MSYLCGCYYHVVSTRYHIRMDKHYLPLLGSEAHSTILSTTSRTVLKQTFTNPSSEEDIKECIYTFPLYDGVSVVSFTCRIGSKVLRGLVKEKVKAKQIFDEAVAKGETAGLLEQAPEASDVFSTKLGNIPAGKSVVVEITYIGELKHHETEGIRFTIPTSIAPRYGPVSNATVNYGSLPVQDNDGIKITVDVKMPEGSFIKGVQSPSHPIAVSMGTVSTDIEADPIMSKASATLSLGSAALEKDFVLIVQAKDIGMPKAILETHPTIPHHRALMATLVPKFSLPPSRPEIVFVADRSGSMAGNIDMLISAMKVFLKSIPVGVKFNICSFGTSCTFLWPQSKSYTAETLAESTAHLQSFSANMGGTETFRAIKATVDRRFTDLPLEIMLLTDGDIWRQEELFAYVNEQVANSKGSIRIFPLGIGNGVSHALIEGLARAGNGFAQSVQHGERLDNSVVRMLRGALSPHITDYTLEVKYDQEEDDFELIERVAEGMKVLLSDSEKTIKPMGVQRIPQLQKPQRYTPPHQATISLFDTSVNPEKDDIKDVADQDLFLPKVPYPKLLQAPHKIPSLFAFSRAVVYLLMSPDTIQRKPTAVVLRATSSHGPLALEIPVEVLPSPAETIHQLAAKKAVQDLEEGRGWIYDAKDETGTLIKDRFPSCFDDLVKKEAVRLGEKFQVAGKWSSFVAVSANDEEIARKMQEGVNLSFLDQEDLVDSSDEDDFEVVNSSRPSSISPQSVEMEAEATGMRARIVGASMRFQNSPARNSAPAHYALSSSPKMALAQPPGFAFTSTASPPMPPKQEKAQRLMKKMSKTPPDTYCGRSSEAAIPPEFGTMPQMNNPSGAAFHGQQQILAQLQAKLAAQRVARPQIQQHAQLLQNSSPGSAQRTGGAGGSLFGGAVSFGQQLSSGLFGSASKPQVGGLFSSSNSAAKHFSQTLQSHETYVSGSIVGNLFGGSMASQNGPATTAGTPSDSFQSIECHAPAPPPPAQSHPFEYKQTYQATFGSCQPLMSQHVHPRKLRSNVVDMSATPIQVDWTSESESEKVLALIALQDFEGSWPYDKEVGQIMGFEIPQRPKGGEQKVWVTLLVVCFLEQKMSGEEGTWGLVVEKARGWLEGSGDMDLEDLEENAKAFVIKN